MKTAMRWMFAGLWLVAAVGVQAEEKLSIKGSNTYGEELGPRLAAVFREQNPSILIEQESLGSASGISALLDGTCDIAASSRAFNEDEQRLALSRGIKVKSTVIGYYGVAVVVNEKNPVKSLSDRAVQDIFTGKVTNWKQVGGPDLPIEVLIRDATGGTHLGFQELAMNRQPYAASARGFVSYTELADVVAASPNAVGYVGMNLVTHAGLHAVSINGIPPNDLSVNEGMYPYVRAVRLFTREDSIRKAAERFIRFARSKSGQKLVESVGFVPASTPRLPVSPGF